MYGIWAFDDRDWLQAGYGYENAILAFRSKRDACRYAAAEYGFDTYTEAKRKGWCVVIPLEDGQPRKRT